MNKKIFAAICVFLVVVLSLPVQGAVEEKKDNPFFNSIQFAQVKIKGSGDEFMLGSVFVFGFGKASILRLKLYDDALIEISELDGADKVVLEGSYTVTLWGFYGFYTHTNQGITVNGVSAIAFWK